MKKRALAFLLSCSLLFSMTLSTVYAAPDTSVDPVETIEEDLQVIDETAGTDEAVGSDEDQETVETEIPAAAETPAPTGETDTEDQEESGDTIDPSMGTLCTYSFDLDGGTGGPFNGDTVGELELFKIPNVTPTKFGYIFIAWEYYFNGKRQLCYPGDMVNINANTTFKAYWNRWQFDFKTGGTEVEKTFYKKLYPGEVAYYVIKTYSPQTWKFETEGTSDTMLAILDASGNVVTQNDDGGTDKNAKITYTFPANSTYYLRLKLYSSTAKAETTMTLKQGYAIKLYESGKNSSPTTCYSWGSDSFELPEPNKYSELSNITLYANGGTFASSMHPLENGTAAKIMVTHPATNWTTADGTEYWPYDTLSKTEITLYPELYWYECYGSEIDDPTESNPYITRSGYTFDGWYTSPTGGTKVRPNYDFPLPGNSSLYAHWSVAPVTITEQPDNVYVANGNKAAFTVEAVGTGLTYQWQYSKDDGKTWINSSATGAKTNTLFFTAKSTYNNYQYRCIVKDAQNNTVISEARDLVVFFIAMNPGSQTYVVNTTASFTVIVNKSDATYQWQYSKDNGKTWINSGASSAKTKNLKFTATKDKNGWLYRCLITDEIGNTLTSKSATLTVFYITKQPATKTFAANTTASFTVASNLSDVTYQWQYSKDNGTTWVDSGAASATTDTLKFTATGSKNGYKYRCIVTCSNGKTVTSSAATLKVFYITKQPVSKTVTAKTSVSFTVATNGSGVTYQWQYSKDKGTTWINSGASSAKTDTLKFTATADKNGWKYRCIVKDSGGRSITSSAVTLTVK